MMALYHMRNNVLIDVTQQRNLLLHVSGMLNSLAIIDADMETVSSQYQFIRNVQQIIQEGTRVTPSENPAPPNAYLGNVITGVIDLTM